MRRNRTYHSTKARPGTLTHHIPRVRRCGRCQLTAKRADAGGVCAMHSCIAPTVEVQLVRSPVNRVELRQQRLAPLALSAPPSRPPRHLPCRPARPRLCLWLLVRPTPLPTLPAPADLHRKIREKPNSAQCERDPHAPRMPAAQIHRTNTHIPLCDCARALCLRARTERVPAAGRWPSSTTCCTAHHVQSCAVCVPCVPVLQSCALLSRLSRHQRVLAADSA